MPDETSLNRQHVEKSISYQDIQPILCQISILGGLNESQQKRLTALLKSVTYERGEYVFKQGDDPSSIYIICSGRVDIVDESASTKTLLAVFKVGDCFGETSVLGIQPHSASAIAAEKTELMVLEREVLIAVFETDKELFGMLVLNIARETCRRLHHVDEVLRAKCGVASRRYVGPEESA